MVPSFESVTVQHYTSRGKKRKEIERLSHIEAQRKIERKRERREREREALSGREKRRRKLRYILSAWFFYASFWGR